MADNFNTAGASSTGSAGSSASTPASSVTPATSVTPAASSAPTNFAGSAPAPASGSGSSGTGAGTAGAAARSSIEQEGIAGTGALDPNARAAVTRSGMIVSPAVQRASQLPDDHPQVIGARADSPSPEDYERAPQRSPAERAALAEASPTSAPAGTGDIAATATRDGSSK